MPSRNHDERLMSAFSTVRGGDALFQNDFRKDLGLKIDAKNKNAGWLGTQ